MAAVAIAGLGGSVTLTAPLDIGISVTGWSGSLDIDDVVVPPAFGAKWEGHKLGAGGFTGSLTGHLKRDVTVAKPFDPTGMGAADWIGMIGSVTLQAEAGCTIVFTAVFHNVVVNRPHGVLPTISCDFANNSGDPTNFTITWVTA